MRELRPGAKIGERYVLESVIAKGGMGAVYKAIDERLGRTVAIKVLLDELADDATSIARFEREATATARLSHPGIVQMFDFGKSDGVSYIVMEHVVGRTLAAELDQRGRLAPLRAAALIEQALAGLSAAHEAGVVHRDIKPGNVMIVPTGSGASAREVVKVLDFGIAQLKDSKPYARLTKLGAVLGTPTFMSPEQARGEPSDPRTDVYATGVVLWCCLTGQRPFQAPDVPKTLQRVLGEMPPRADTIDASIPAAIAQVVEKAVEKRPNARWPTALAFADALAEARGASSGATTTAVRSSLPSAPSSEPVTRQDTRLATPAPITRESVPAFAPIASAGEPPSTRPGTGSWRRPVAIGVGITLIIGVLLGVAIVLGVIGLEYGRAALPPAASSPPVMVPTAEPPPTQTPPREPAIEVARPRVVVTADACPRFMRCCDAYRRVDPDMPACEELLRDMHEGPEECARQTDALGREAPQLAECMPAVESTRERRR